MMGMHKGTFENLCGRSTNWLWIFTIIQPSSNHSEMANLQY